MSVERKRNQTRQWNADRETRNNGVKRKIVGKNQYLLKKRVVNQVEAVAGM